MLLTELFAPVEQRLSTPMLFHGTSPDSAGKILYSDTIRAMTTHGGYKLSRNEQYVAGVSLTRSLQFAREYHSEVRAVVFALDARALRARTKIIPVDYFANTKKNGDYYRVRKESEEFAIGDIKPLSRYLKWIEMPKSLWQECFEQDEEYNPGQNILYGDLLHHPLLRLT